MVPVLFLAHSCLPKQAAVADACAQEFGETELTVAIRVRLGLKSTHIPLFTRIGSYAFIDSYTEILLHSI